MESGVQAAAYSVSPEWQLIAVGIAIAIGYFVLLGLVVRWLRKRGIISDLGKRMRLENERRKALS